MWRSLYLVIFFSPMVGCVHNLKFKESIDREALKSSKWDDITLSESFFSEADASVDTSSGKSNHLSYKDLVEIGEPKKIGTSPATLSNIDYYRRLSFYLGAVGGIYSFIADSQENVRGRTLGNAVWGIGWTCWLGFGAVVRADIKKIMDEHNETFVANASKATVVGGADNPNNSWALLWQLRSF
jgi:hypothetical protein